MNFLLIFGVKYVRSSKIHVQGAEPDHARMDRFVLGHVELKRGLLHQIVMLDLCFLRYFYSTNPLPMFHDNILVLSSIDKKSKTDNSMTTVTSHNFLFDTSSII
jgi:hypothetical protein